VYTYDVVESDDDGNELSRTETTATITITGENDAPVVTVTNSNDFVQNSGNAVGDVVATYTTADIDGDAVSVSLSDTTHYALSTSSQDGTLQVTLTQAGLDLVNAGTDLPAFTLTPNDGSIDGDPKDVDPSVTPSDDSPTTIFLSSTHLDNQTFSSPYTNQLDNDGEVKDNFGRDYAGASIVFDNIDSSQAADFTSNGNLVYTFLDDSGNLVATTDSVGISDTTKWVFKVSLIYTSDTVDGTDRYTVEQYQAVDTPTSSTLNKDSNLISGGNSGSLALDNSTGADYWITSGQTNADASITYGSVNTNATSLGVSIPGTGSREIGTNQFIRIDYVDINGANGIGSVQTTNGASVTLDVSSGTASVMLEAFDSVRPSISQITYGTNSSLTGSVDKDSPINFTLTLDRAITSLAAADLDLPNGVSIANLESADGGLTWTGTLAVKGNSTVSLDGQSIAISSSAGLIEAIAQPDKIEQVIIELGGSTWTVNRPATGTTQVTLDIQGNSVVVDFSDPKAVTLTGLDDGATVGARTANGYTALEVTNVGADGFTISGTGTFSGSSPTGLTAVSFDLKMVDGDAAGNEETLQLPGSLDLTFGGNVLGVTNGQDTLIGTTGADIFEWNLADNNSISDVIKNFDASQDAIDLGDLLSGYQEGDDLSNFISVTYDSNSGNTVISVSSNGDGTVNQTITVEGVNLQDADGDGDAVSMSTLLEQLRTGSIIDPDSGG
jgi:hypothetical protein